jgi:hypothetical protein
MIWNNMGIWYGVMTGYDMGIWYGDMTGYDMGIWYTIIWVYKAWYGYMGIWYGVMTGYDMGIWYTIIWVYKAWYGYMIWVYGDVTALPFRLFCSTRRTPSRSSAADPWWASSKTCTVDLLPYTMVDGVRCVNYKRIRQATRIAYSHNWRRRRRTTMGCPGRSWT